MDKNIQAVKSYITKEENRTTIAATAGIVAIVAGIVYTMKRGTKRK